jgi:DNA-directed RNA polymerase alpha subunit
MSTKPTIYTLFGARLQRALSDRGIITLAQIRTLKHTDVLKLRWCGWASVVEIHNRLAELGIDWPGYAVRWPKRHGGRRG